MSSIYGEYTHTQTLEELVEHSHEVGEGSIMPTGSFDRLYASGDDKTSVADSYSETKTAGEGKPFNIVQPSVTVFIWMRIKRYGRYILNSSNYDKECENEVGRTY